MAHQSRPVKGVLPGVAGAELDHAGSRGHGLHGPVVQGEGQSALEADGVVDRVHGVHAAAVDPLVEVGFEHPGRFGVAVAVGAELVSVGADLLVAVPPSALLADRAAALLHLRDALA
jgi:hypothetical protein